MSGLVFARMPHWSQALLVYGAVLEVNTGQRVALLLPSDRSDSVLALRQVWMPAAGKLVVELSVHGATKRKPSRQTLTVHWCPPDEDELLPARILEVSRDLPFSESPLRDCAAELPAILREAHKSAYNTLYWAAPLLRALADVAEAGVTLPDS